MRMIVFMALTFLACALAPVLANSSKKSEPLFNQKELQELEYLKSSQYLMDKNTIETIEQSRQRMKAALKLYALGDRQKRQAYYLKDVWALEDKREDYFTLMNWLKRISPLSKVKNRPKETK